MSHEREAIDNSDLPVEEDYLEKMAPMRIYDWDQVSTDIPIWANAIVVKLDATIDSHMDWTEQARIARQFVKKGLYVLFELDLGLFDRLKHPLTHQTQFLSLSLAIEHFRDFFWNDLKSKSLGVILYRGSLDFTDDLEPTEHNVFNLQEWLQDKFSSVEALAKEIGIKVQDFTEINFHTLRTSISGEIILQLYCRDVYLDYLDLLASRLSDSIKPHLLFNARGLMQPLVAALLSSSDRLDRYWCSFQSVPFQLSASTWALGTSGIGYIGLQEPDSSWTIYHPETISLGVCVPTTSDPHASRFIDLQQALSFLIEKRIPFRLIPEDKLTMEWDGLDELIVLASGLSSSGVRKLKGFAAAQGTIVYLDPPPYLSEGMDFQTWLSINYGK